MRSWKDRGLRRAGALVGELVLAAVAPVVADAVVPVPPAPARARRRGVDGPAQLATALAGGWGLPPPMSLLARTGARPQRDLARDERRRNARSSFSVSHAGRASPAPPLDGAVVLLVDDVYTTGATADACARLLRRLGASRVEVVTFARVVR